MIRKFLNIGSKRGDADVQGPGSSGVAAKKKLSSGVGGYKKNFGDDEPTQNDDSHTSFNNSESDFTMATMSSSLSSFNNASLNASLSSPSNSVKSRVPKIDEVQEDEEVRSASPKSENKPIDDEDDGGSRPPPDESSVKRPKKSEGSSKRKKRGKSVSDKKKKNHPSSADNDDDPESRPMSSRTTGSNSSNTKGKKSRSRSRGAKNPKKAKSLRARLGKREKSEDEPDEIIERLFVKDDSMGHVSKLKWDKWRSTGDLMVKPSLQTEAELVEQLKKSQAGGGEQQAYPKSPKIKTKPSATAGDDLYSRLSKMTLQTVVSGEELVDRSPSKPTKKKSKKDSNESGDKKKSKKKPSKKTVDDRSSVSENIDGDRSSGTKTTSNKVKRPSTKVSTVADTAKVDDENVASTLNKKTPKQKKSNKLWKSTGDLGSYLVASKSSKMSMSMSNASWHSTDDGEDVLGSDDGEYVDDDGDLKPVKRAKSPTKKVTPASPKQRKSGLKPKRISNMKIPRLLGEVDDGPSDDDNDEITIGSSLFSEKQEVGQTKGESAGAPQSKDPITEKEEGDSGATDLRRRSFQKQEHNRHLAVPNMEEEGSSGNSTTSSSRGSMSPDLVKSSSWPEQRVTTSQMELSGKLQHATSQLMEQKFVIASLKKELAAYQDDDEATTSSDSIRKEGWKYAQHKIHTLQAQNYHLKTANTDLESELRRARQELEEKAAEHDQLVIDLYDIECDETDAVRSLKNELEDAQKQIVSLEEENKSLQERKTDEAASSVEATNAFARQREDLQTTVRDITRQIRELSEAKSAQLEEKKDAIKKLEQDIESLSAKIQRFTSQAGPHRLGSFLQKSAYQGARGTEDESIDSRILSLNEELLQNQTALKVQIDKLSVQNSELHDKLDRELRGSSTQLSQGASQLKARMTEIETLKNELATAKQIVMDLEGENEKLQASNSYLKTDLEDAKERNICLAKSLAEQETKILDLQTRVIDREAAWKQELQELLQDTSGLEARIDEERLKTSAKLSKQELELAATNVTIAALRAELAESKKKLDEMNKDLNSVTEHLTSKSSECYKLKSGIADRDSKIKDMELKLLQKKSQQYQNAFDVTRENAALKRQVEDEISKLRFKIEERDMRIQGLSKKLAQHEANLTREALSSKEKLELQSEIAKNELEISKLKKVLAERDLKVKFLDDVLSQSKAAWMQERNSLMKDQSDLLSKLEEAMEALQKESANRELIIRASDEEGALIEARYREQVRALSEQNSALKANIAEKDSAIAKLQNDLIERDLIFESYDVAAGLWNQERMKLMEDSTTSRGALELAVNTLQKQVSERDTRIQELDRELKNDECGLRQLLAVSEGEKRALQESLKKNEYTIASLRRELNYKDTMTKGGDDSVEQAKAETSSLRTRLNSERRASMLQLASKDDVIDTIRMELEEKDSRIEWLEQCLKRKEADWRYELGELLQETADLTNEGRTTAAELASKNGIIAALEEELREKDSRLREYAKEKSGGLQKLSKLEQVQMNIVSEDMKDELLLCKAEMAKSATDLDEARRRIAELEDVVSSIESTKVFLDTKSSHGERSSFGEEGRLQRELAKRRIKLSWESKAKHTKSDSSTESERSADQAAGISSRF